MKNLLFISHDASRTGAPILLLRLMLLLKEKGYHLNTIIRQGGGELTEEFKKISDEFLIYPPGRKLTTVTKVKRKFFNKYYPLNLSRILKNVDCVISNTITNGEVLVQIRKNYSGPVITYVHELKMASSYFTTAKHIENVLTISQHFFVPCKTVKDFLTNDFSVISQKISFLNYYIPDSFIIVNNKEKLSALTKRTFIVGGIGTIDWRKAPDVFILIAKAVQNKYPAFDIIFKWKGGNKNSVEFARLTHEISMLGLSAKVEFTDTETPVEQFVAAIDVLLLTSREDPYPLVVLESASFRKPTICFNNSGGAVEFVENDAGKIISYMSIEEASEAIVFYYQNSETLAQHGEAAFQKVMTRHCNKEMILGQFAYSLKAG